MERELSMQTVNGSGVLCGFRNKTSEENRRWWGTRKWMVQMVIWLALISGVSATAMMQLSQNAANFSLTEAVGVFAGLMGWMAAFGVIILNQGDIVDEKQSGTAEWILSSPLSRESFILSKLVVNLLWLLGLVVVLQGVIFNLIIGFFNIGPIPWLSLGEGLGLQGLHMAFWLSLIIMLGTFFKGRNPVIGIPLVLLFFQEFIPTIFGSSISWVALLLPQRLPEYSTDLFTGKALPSLVPVVTILVASTVFILLAIFRFRREEFKGA